MPRILTKIFITGIITLFAAQAFAQKGVEDGSKYGHKEDSIRCLTNLSLFTEYVKQKSYADAIESWEICFNECPLSSTKIYTDGIKIMEYRINKEKDSAKKEQLIQQLMGIYDQRIKYFGSSKKNGEDYILGRKAVNLLDYKKTDPASRVLAQEWFEKSIKGRGNRSELAVLVTYMTCTDAMYKADQIEAEEVVNNYVTINNILAKQIEVSKGEKTKAQLQKYKDIVEKVFATSGAADCEIIEKIYGPQLAENVANVDWLRLVSKLLARGNCEEAQLSYDVAVKLYEIEPSSSAAYMIAVRNLKTLDLDVAAKYYTEAISLEEDPAQKAKFTYQLGLVKQNQGQLIEARNLAQQAIALKSDWGDPYILIGNLYANAARSFGNDEFEHKTVYWAAVDQFYKAKSIDASVADKANELISIYSQHFPGTEEIFFHTLQVGDSYTVGGWIGVSTKVRAKN
jgi:tetratricopeptide (TPR) repeat protein